uniref:Uncharacterized protein n=1 Tax=Anguilla anguilla TaxID=7936 RepID=A0A0E9Q496_ANGAN
MFFFLRGQYFWHKIDSIDEPQMERDNVSNLVPYSQGHDSHLYIYKDYIRIQKANENIRTKIRVAQQEILILLFFTNL